MIKRIICLANSNKNLGNNSGRCIAGKDVSNYSAWIRPISSRSTEEISEQDRTYAKGEKPSLLDIIRIKFIERKPNTFQTENYLINDKYYWAKEDTCDRTELDNLVDNPDNLWENHNSSYNGINDRISEDNTEKFDNSLYFIESSIRIVVATEGKEFGNPIKKVRCRFNYNGKIYKLPVTDPIIKDEYLDYEEGDYDLGNKYMCISLGLCYSRDPNSERHAYLFVTSII